MDFTLIRGRRTLTGRWVVAGTYQIFIDWRERVGADYGREAEPGNVAGNMVLGVSGWEAQEESAGNGARGEGVMEREKRSSFVVMTV